MRWAWHIAGTGKEEACSGFWWKNLRERDYLTEPGIDWRIKLRRIFREWDIGVWIGLSWLRIETGGGRL
jgi:hypothetical protein